MEVVRMEAEEFGGLGEIALGLLEGGEDELFFCGANSVMEIGGGFGNRQCAIRERVGEIFGKTEAELANDDAALAGVLKFGDINGPIILGQAGAGGRGESADLAIGARGVTGDEMV